ncbi:FMN-binding domain-containing protein [Tindallia californiensis]|uniref:FMN-binding domain-containing protein n=2 Tax=Tindallia californiensis TaxID=159292 RepID=A0A1H3MFT0_9FIRM|nr:FMN-binding domain-containing protein [Tindallia californiensis]
MLSGIFVCAMLIASLIWGKQLIELMEYRNEVDAIQLLGIQLDAVEDGIYYGEKDALMVKAEVMVKVEGQKIRDITLEHTHGRGEAAEVLADKVIEKQDTAIDTISGATASSKVILKSIENALMVNK